MQGKLRLTSALFALLLVGVARPVDAQDLEWRLHGGIVQPIGGSGSYYDLGPSLGVDVGLPLSDALNAMVDLDFEWFQPPDIYASPATTMWRYRLGLEAKLMEDRFSVRGLAGVGATTTNSGKFWLESRRPYTYEGERISQTALTATGGLRFGWQTPDDIAWWLTAKMDWTPLSDSNQDALRELSRHQLDALGSAVSLAITLGVTLW